MMLRYRSSSWREHANRVYTQWQVVEIELGVLVKQGRMAVVIQLYCDRKPLLCERLQTATESWLQSLWRRVKIQHQRMILSMIAAQWQLTTRMKHSVIYQLVSTRTTAGHVGMDEFRVYTERYKEHLTNIRDHLFSLDKKYAFMSRMGGPGSWFMVPHVFSSRWVPKQLILALESREIQLYPKHLNTEQRYRRKQVNAGTGAVKHAERARRLPQTRWKHRGNAPVRLQLMYGNTDTPNVVDRIPTPQRHLIQLSQSSYNVMTLYTRPFSVCTVSLTECRYSDTLGDPRSCAWHLAQVNRLLVAYSLHCDGSCNSKDGVNFLTKLKSDTR